MFVLNLLIAVSVAAVQLPTGARLDPAGRAIQVGNFPLAMAAAPNGKHVIVVLSGWKTQGLQVVDIDRGAITQAIEKPASEARRRLDRGVQRIRSDENTSGAGDHAHA